MTRVQQLQRYLVADVKNFKRLLTRRDNYRQGKSSQGAIHAAIEHAAHKLYLTTIATAHALRVHGVIR